jgi:transposase-like protein
MLEKQHGSPFGRGHMLNPPARIIGKWPLALAACTAGMQDALPPCPRRGAAHVVRNGHTRVGFAVALCRGRRRSFCPDPKRPPITPDREESVRSLLRERLSLRAVARTAGVSRSWLQRFADRVYRDDAPHHPEPLKNSPAGS